MCAGPSGAFACRSNRPNFPQTLLVSLVDKPPSSRTLTPCRIAFALTRRSTTLPSTPGPRLDHPFAGPCWPCPVSSSTPCWCVSCFVGFGHGSIFPVTTDAFFFLSHRPAQSPVTACMYTSHMSVSLLFISVVPNMRSACLAPICIRAPSTPQAAQESHSGMLDKLRYLATHSTSSFHAHTVVSFLQISLLHHPPTVDLELDLRNQQHNTARFEIFG